MEEGLRAVPKTSNFQREFQRDFQSEHMCKPFSSQAVTIIKGRVFGSFFCRELSGHCPREEPSAPGQLSPLSERMTPHLALETLQQPGLKTVAGVLDVREMSNHSIEGEFSGRLRHVQLSWTGDFGLWHFHSS